MPHRLIPDALFALVLSVAAAMAQAPAPDPMDEAFRAAQLVTASAAGRAIRQIGLRTAAGDDALAALVRARQALAERLETAEAAMAGPAADRVALAGEAAGVEAELARLDTQIAAGFPAYAELTRPGTLSVAEVQALLHPDEALILVHVAANNTFVWAISPDRAGWLRVSVTESGLTEAVAALRASLGPDAAPADTRAAAALAPAMPRPVRAFDRTLSYGIHSALLGGLAPVLDGAAHVFVVADGALTALPFSVLVTRPPEGDDADPAAQRATAWMIRDHALTTLPSVEALRVVRRAGAAPPADRPAVAGVGDPVLGGGMALAGLSRGAGLTQGGLMQGGLADVEQIRLLPPLPQTRGELRRIARVLGAGPDAVRLGAEATERAVKQADLRAGVLAFATHGLLSGEVPGLTEPALVLTPPAVADRTDDGLLTASEIAELRIDADWVILSACNTAGGESPEAEGLSGLARAFLFAGARAILVSHWPVRDDAAARLTTDTFSRLASGETRGKAEALRRAMLALMNDPRDPTLAAPASWAPFVLVGDGG
jgi:CHAT domain-containing protein